MTVRDGTRCKRLDAGWAYKGQCTTTGYNRITDFSGAFMKHGTLAIAVGLSFLVVFTAPDLSGAGAHRRRHQREDPNRRPGQLEDPADHALPHGCVRAAPDRLAQPEGGRRVGRQRDGVLGLHQRPSRAVGFRPGPGGPTTSPSARSSRRSRTSSSSRCWPGRRARTARSGPRRSISFTARSADERRARDVPREREGQRQERHRPRRAVAGRCRSTSNRRPSERPDDVAAQIDYNGAPGRRPRGTRRARPR